MTRDLPFAHAMRQTNKNKCLLPNDMKFIVKAIRVIHGPTLDTLCEINKKSGLHQFPLGEKVLSIKCSICHCPVAA